MGELYGSRWEIVRSLGEGGQAHTFIARDTHAPEAGPYVLKRLKNLGRLARFTQEVQAVGALSHPNVVKLIDFDLDVSRPYIVTEYCEGGNLEEADPFWIGSPGDAFRIFDEICQGVVAAHNAGIIHRDLKPANIFLRSRLGPAVVGDFGICFVLEDGTRLTLTDEAVGARLFIAPELEDGRTQLISEKSDTYSLGKILYWLLSGKRVFGREKYREPSWDLKRRNADAAYGWDNIYMEHANRLLDLMITPTPESRRSVRNIEILARRTAHLIAREFNPVDPAIPQPCKYCGHGHYVIKAQEFVDVRNFGFNTVGSPNWRILVCDECGHTAIFRVDMAARKEWWST